MRQDLQNLNHYSDDTFMQIPVLDCTDQSEQKSWNLKQIEPKIYQKIWRKITLKKSRPKKTDRIFCTLPDLWVASGPSEIWLLFRISIRIFDLDLISRYDSEWQPELTHLVFSA